MTSKTEAKKTTPLTQSVENRVSGADAATLPSAATATAVKPRPASPLASAAGLGKHDPRETCSQCITMSIFFDGTGNNIDADTPSREHSNVARLFNVHHPSDDTKQVYRRYVPGIGTYFKDIGDPGGTTTGRGMGALGQKRLDWAFKELATVLKKAEARANNPGNRIVKVRIAVFGFSRGAALARAFCRDLQKSCTGQRGGFKLRAGALGTSGMMVKGGYAIEVFFLGIFDTVASVGLPMSTNNVLTKRRSGLGWRDLITDYAQAHRDLKYLAFGEPGADPSPGPADGHGAWASDGLQIPPIVSQCVHMVAAHETRNSFPLDSALEGLRYPVGTEEMVYPGVHSDVGAGYRHGEGGKADVLALVPLRSMLTRAVAAGVPMHGLAELQTEDQKLDFGLAGEPLARFNELAPLWSKYMSTVPTDLPLGRTVLAHMRQYWLYRISAAVLRTAKDGKKTLEQRTIESNEATFKKQRAELEAEAKAKKAAYQTASANRMGAEEGLEAAKNSPAFKNQVPMWESMVRDAKQKEAEAMDIWRRAQARADTAANDGDLLENMETYDEWLLEDAAVLYKWHKEEPSKRMRPHYKAIVDAYEQVVIQKKPLAETSDLYRFFSMYVHDSLSGFATDNTRTTDPRVLYVGGDSKEEYAAIQRPGTGQMAA